MPEQFERNLLLFSPSFLKQKEYWTSKLQIQDDTELLTPEAGSVDGPSHQVYKYQFSTELSSSILKLGNSSDFSIFIIFASALKILIGKYHGTDTSAIITPLSLSGPPSEVNQFVILQDTITEEISFKDTLIKVSHTVIDAYKHQEYPQDRILELLGINHEFRRMSKIICRFNDVHVDGIIERVDDIIIDFARNGANVKISVSYDASIYRTVYIRQMVVHLEKILVTCVVDVAVIIRNISILTDVETVSMKNPDKNDQSSDESFVKSFKRCVLNVPDRIAVQCGQELISYSELDICSDRIGGYLSDHMLLRGDDVVMLLMDRDISFAKTCLAIWKAGTAYLPVDPLFPVERIQAIIDVAKPKVIIVDPKYLSLTVLLDYPSAFLSLEDVIAIGNESADFSPSHSYSAGDLAYIIFTSGSTGLPKGVMIEHRGMINHMKAKINDFYINETDIIAQNASQCFDISVWQFFSGLIAGAKTVIYRNEDIGDVANFLVKIQADKITILEVVPSYLGVMLDYLEMDTISNSLKFLLVTGEVLKTQLTKRWFALFPAVPIANVYGPTEASDDVTHYLCYEPVTAHNVPIGRPIRNVSVYILNQRMQFCPRGISGEIFVSGVCVGRGYLNDMTKTKAAFIPDIIDVNQRMYRTGDIGKYNCDGNIEYLGRRDQQVKIKGSRIELGEVKYHLDNISGIYDSVVLKLQSKTGEDYLCGYYVLDNKADLDDEEIHRQLTGKLPAFMIPSFLIKLKSFPLTRSGKIDTSAFTLPHFNSNTVEADASAYSSIQLKLIDLWKRILGVTDVSFDDNFFDLGGHSLSAARLLVYIQKEFKVKFKLETVFNNPTVWQLAPLITGGRTEELDLILPVPYSSLYELSQAQKRLWVIGELEEEKYVFNIPQAYILKGRLDVKALEKAIIRLINRHETLRTTFTNSDGTPMQKIRDFEDLNFEFCFQDLSALSQADRDSILDERVRLEEKFPFDLNTGPLIRTTLLKLEEDKHAFLLTIHHIICDGWSIDVMKNDLFSLYNAFVNDQPDPLPHLFIQYKDYAGLQRKQIADGKFNEQKKYWINKFEGGIPILDLPTDFRRPPEKTYNGHNIELSLGKQLSSEIEIFCRLSGVSKYMFLSAAIKMLLYRYTGQTDIILGSPVAARSHHNLEDQIGFYVNILAIRSSFEKASTFNDLLEIVKANALEAFANENYPFDHLVDALALNRDLSRSPLFDVLLVFQNAELKQHASVSMEGVSIETLLTDRSVVKYDLSFNFSDDEEQLSLSLEYNSDLFKTQRIERLASHLIHIISQVISDPYRQMQAIEIITGEERKILLHDFNKSGNVRQTGANCIDLFHEQVVSSPLSTALVFESKKYNYQQLDHRSNQFADFLISRQVEPGDSVMVMLDRSEWSVVCFIGILKVNACYVPIETETPINRLRFIASDLKPKIILVSTPDHADCLATLGSICDVSSLNLDQFSTFRLSCKICPEDSSYIIYTSGSTGTPKGVVQTHRTLSNLINWQMESWGEITGYRFLQHASFGFDASIHDTLFCLCGGGTLFLVKEESRTDFRFLKDMIISNEIDVIWFTFSTLVALFAEMEEDFEKLSLRHIVTTGEAAGLDNKLGEYLQRVDGFVLHNFYGPSETHVITSFEVTGRTNSLMPTLSIGKPISNTKIYILNDAFQLQPCGVIGEIYVQTAGAFKGYLNQPDLTSNVFANNPFSANELMYRTGDLGRWDDDGNIEFFGRVDSQVKLRGFRIELKEIETVIAEFKDIDMCVVVYISPGKSEKVLVAYVVTQKEFDQQGLHAYLVDQLPQYMIPSHIVPLSRLPLNKNGKLDVKSLPDPSQFHNRENLVSAEGLTEKHLHTIWCEILDRPDISVTENFFRIGGHSLTATRMASKIFREFNVEISLRTIYRHSTIRELAQEIDVGSWLKMESIASDGQRKKLTI